MTLSRPYLCPCRHDAAAFPPRPNGDSPCHAGPGVTARHEAVGTTLKAVREQP